jgi:hypothetical protein
MNIHAKEEREQGDNHDPSAQAGQRAEEASGEGPQGHECGEVKSVQRCS